MFSWMQSAERYQNRCSYHVCPTCRSCVDTHTHTRFCHSRQHMTLVSHRVKANQGVCNKMWDISTDHMLALLQLGRSRPGGPFVIVCGARLFTRSHCCLHKVQKVVFAFQPVSSDFQFVEEPQLKALSAHTGINNSMLKKEEQIPTNRTLWILLWPMSCGLPKESRIFQFHLYIAQNLCQKRGRDSAHMARQDTRQSSELIMPTACSLYSLAGPAWPRDPYGTWLRHYNHFIIGGLHRHDPEAEGGFLAQAPIETRHSYCSVCISKCARR